MGGKIQFYSQDDSVNETYHSKFRNETSSLLNPSSQNTKILKAIQIGDTLVTIEQLRVQNKKFNLDYSFATLNIISKDSKCTSQILANIESPDDICFAKIDNKRFFLGYSDSKTSVVQLWSKHEKNWEIDCQLGKEGFRGERIRSILPVFQDQKEEGQCVLVFENIVTFWTV